MSSTHKKTFKKNLLTTALTLATATTAQAGLVRADVDYQYYRDFGENKGQFGLNGDTPANVEIIDKQGKSLGTVLQGVPMIDLAVGSRGDGIATLVDPQYVVSVQHNAGYQTVQFGDHSSANLDSHHFDYQVTDRHLKAPGVSIGSWHRDDYHSPRLHKLVTEVAPIPIANETHIGAYLNKEKYPVFVRSGGGTQRALEQPGNVEKDVAGPYLFVTGGEMLDLIEVVADSATNIPGNSKQTLMRIKGFDDLHNHPLGIMQRRGDSGSGVFAWDAQVKRWVYAMSVQSSTPSNSFSIAHLGFMEENRQKAIAGEISATGKTLNWTPEGNTSTITGGDTPLTVGLYDSALLERDGQQNAQGVASSQWHRPRQNAGKTFTITGDDNVLKLAGDVNQGSGAIYFKGNTTVEGATAGTTWLGAGVSIDKDKTVTWKVHNPDQDRLSKIGEGTLLVQGTGKNMGSISVGDGKVILDQKADANNQKQAFDEVGIVSGRPTVVLNSSDQVNPDYIYFGFRGGRLDVNGNDLTFNRIQNADSGAKIVNNNMTDPAKITLNRTKNFSSSGEVPLETNRWASHKPVGFYEARRTDGTIDYFVLKEGKVPQVAFPTGKRDGASWTYLTSGTKQDAIRAFLELKKNDPLVARKDAFFGFLGETDDSKNGRLDVEYNPTLKDDLYILNGGSNLNGTLAVKNGTLMLSGTPVPHAYDHLNKQDVVKENEWIDRHFTASNFQITGGVLTTSRNVGSITGDINASEQGRVNLGVVNGETEYCYRSDYSGVVHCSATAIADNLIVPVNVKGNATASDTAHIQIANSNIVGNVRASNQATITIKDNTTISDGVTLRDTAKLTFANSKNALTKVTGSRHSQVNMQAGSHWQLADNSTVGQLTGETGSQISLNSSKADTYQQLTVNGDLTGNLTFNMATDLAQGKADKLIVNGYANGGHQLAVQNTGNEANVDELTLVELRHGAQESGDAKFALVGGEVHAGALRYTLETDASNRYFLYNPTKADELAKQRQAEAEKARADEEKAKQDLADAIAAREKAEQDKQRAEEALKQALANSGTSSQSLLDAQRQLEEAHRLAEQAQAEKARAEAQLTQKELELTNANNAKAEAERLKAEADRQAQTARDEQARLQTELNDANRAKETAEQAKKQADDARILAEQNAQTAQNEKAQAEAKQREAEAKQQEAENQRKTAQNALDTANQQKQALEQQLADAIASGNSDTASLREQLAKATAQISEKEQALTEANTAKAEAERQKATAEGEKQRAESALNQARQQLEEANRAKDDANNRATQAENQKQAVEQNLTTVQAQLTQAQADKQTAEQKARDAEIAKNNAEQAKQALEQAQTAQAEALKNAQEALKVAESQKQASDLAKQNAETAQKLAEAEAQRQADLAKQAETEKNRQAELARQADLAKQQAETAQKLAEDAKNQALTDLTNAEQAKAQAELAKTQAENAQKLADTAREHAEKALQTALTDKQTAETAKAKAESDLTTALREKQLAEDALKLAQQNGNQDVVNLQNQLAQANQAVKDKELALVNAETAKQNAETAQKLAESQRDNALKSAETAEQAKNQAETTLATVRQQLVDAQNQKQASDLAKQQAEDEANRQSKLARQALAEQERLAELARQAEASKLQAQAEADRQAQTAKSAETAQKVAELNAQNAKNAQKVAEEAQAVAETARQKAEEAILVLDEANKRLQATIDADATTIAQAKAGLATAQKLADERQAILTLAQTNLTNANNELAKVRQENALIEAQLQQEKALRTKAEVAQAEALATKDQADKARLEAIDAQTKSEAERQEAQAKLAQAEKLAEQKQAEADQAETARLALASQLSTSLARLQSTQADLVLAETKTQEAEARQQVAEAELAKLKAQEAQRQVDALARQASQQKQADVISQYANVALSEVSATAHHLHRVSERIDERLHGLNGQNSGIWLQTDSEKTRHASDQYRDYEQDSQLTQIGMDKTTAFGAGDLTMGASLNHLRYQASFDDDFTGKGQTVSGTLYGKWQHNNGFTLTADMTAGRATSELAQQARTNDVERTVGGVGLGVAKTFKVGDVDAKVHAGVKHHYLGNANYAITASDNSQAQVTQDDINIVSYQAGADIGRNFQTATGLNIRPSVGVGYRHTDSEGKVAINSQVLTQKFANELQGQAGIAMGKESWEIKLQADFAKNNESGYRNSASFGVNWKW